MKRLSLNYLFAIVALFSLGFMSGCSKDDETPAVVAPEFNTSLNNSVTLVSNYMDLPCAPSGTFGSFYASSTKAVGNKTTSDATKVDITYMDVASTGTATDVPTFVSPDYRTNFSGENQPGATTTTFGATTLDISTATAQQVKDATDPTAKSVTLTNGSTYLFKNAAGKKGIIKITGLPTTCTSSGANTTTNVNFDIKVLK